MRNIDFFIDQSNSSSSSALVKNFVIPYNELKMSKELGSGTFGVVYVAEWRNQRVAVKKMKGNYSKVEVEKFKDEANLLSNLRPHSKKKNKCVESDFLIRKCGVVSWIVCESSLYWYFNKVVFFV